YPQSHFMLPSAEKLYGDEDFVFQHDLAPAHSAKTTGKWFTDHGITVESVGYCEEKVERPFWASITPQQCHRLIASMPRRIEAVISAKGFPTKY
uniref:Uncharacterized protein n=1 Tax=Cyprinus carpio TaxID=7962 RepID=A0A8C2FTB6_CYPCA